MSAENLESALIVGPDWPLVDPSATTGCDALVTRYLEHPGKHSIVFSQAPPGLVGCVISAAMMADLAKRTRRNSIGALLTYIPDVPQRDPATMELCVKLPAALRNRAERITFDSGARRDRLRAAFDSLESDDVLRLNAHDIFAALDNSELSATLPQQVEIELCTRRSIDPPWLSAAERGVRPMPMNIALVEKITQELALRDDVTMALGGLGDPFLHPQFSEIVKLIRDHGIDALQVQTDLLDFADPRADLLELPIDVISVNLNADRAAIYDRTMQSNRFADVICKLEKLINDRHEQAGRPEGLTLPWIVPTLSRQSANLEDLQAFFDRWSYFLNAAVIEPGPQSGIAKDGDDPESPPLIHVPIPPEARQRMDQNEMLILADGSVPLDSDDRIGTTSIGNVNDDSIAVLWQRLLTARRKRRPIVRIIKTEHSCRDIDTAQSAAEGVATQPELVGSR